MYIPYIFNDNPPTISCESYREHALKDPGAPLDGEQPLDHCDSMIGHQHTCRACIEWQIGKYEKCEVPALLLRIRDKRIQDMRAILALLPEPTEDQAPGRV